MTCTHRYQDTGLQCTREEHEGTGHVYDAGTWMNDRHGEQGHG